MTYWHLWYKVHIKKFKSVVQHKAAINVRGFLRGNTLIGWYYGIECPAVLWTNPSIKAPAFRTTVTIHANALHQIHCQLNRIIRWLLGYIRAISLRLVEHVIVPGLLCLVSRPQQIASRQRWYEFCWTVKVPRDLSSISASFSIRKHW